MATISLPTPPLPQEDAKPFTCITCPGHSRPVPDLSFSLALDRGMFLLSSCLDGKPMMRDGTTGDWIGTFVGHKGAVWCARFSPDASRIITASAEFSCKLFNTDDGSELKTFDHDHIVKTVAFSHDATQFLSGGHEKKLRVWNLTHQDAAPTVYNAPATITHIVIPPPTIGPGGASLLATAGDEAGVRLWDLRTADSVRVLPTKSTVASLQSIANGSIIVSASGRTVSFWNVETLELIKEYDLDSDRPGNALLCAALSPNSALFAVGSREELVTRVYDYQTGREVGCQKGHHGPVRCVDWSPDGFSYATGSEDGSIRMWNTILTTTPAGRALIPPREEDEDDEEEEEEEEE